jgi:ribonuclease BN (tRNA processing enzyme)
VLSRLRRHGLESPLLNRRIAEAAGVHTLVLSHLVPPDDPEISEEMWVEAAKLHFSGKVILGRDLLEV